jgi:hypothetical protein
VPKLYVLNVEEFAGLVESARRKPGCKVTDTGRAYTIIESDAPLIFDRREIKAWPAVWYSAFSGGIDGQFIDFGRDGATLADS